MSMSLNLGYLVSTGIFGFFFVIMVATQISAKRFHPALYWTTIIATTTVGTTLADFTDRSLGIGYAGGVTILSSLLAASLFLWYRTLGSLAVGSVNSRSAEIFYWVTIMLSQTLGTALGDWTADTAGMGYSGGAILFGAMLGVQVCFYFFTKVSRTGLFWAAFILTRPLGAVIGDLLDKPAAQGGFELSRITASVVLLVIIGLAVVALPQRAAEKAH